MWPAESLLPTCLISPGSDRNTLLTLLQNCMEKDETGVCLQDVQGVTIVTRSRVRES